jgi:YfiH family protein
LKIIQSKIFSQFPEIKFGFSTKKGGVSPPPYYMNLNTNVGDSEENVKNNREKFFGALGIGLEDISIQRQIHSTNIKYVSTPGYVKDCDGLYTDKKNNFLVISGADCITIFLYEPHKKVVAGIHSGWKGTYGKILTKAVQELQRRFSIDVSELMVYIGPSISQDYYEVGEEVAELFEDDIKFFKNGKYHLDLKKSNIKQLLKLGVGINNIEVSGYCTYRDKYLFHSHRRVKGKTGRMFGVIGMV